MVVSIPGLKDDQGNPYKLNAEEERWFYDSLILAGKNSFGGIFGAVMLTKAGENFWPLLRAGFEKAPRTKFRFYGLAIAFGAVAGLSLTTGPVVENLTKLGYGSPMSIAVRQQLLMRSVKNSESSDNDEN